jgi:flagellar protein FliL
MYFDYTANRLNNIIWGKTVRKLILLICLMFVPVWAMAGGHGGEGEGAEASGPTYVEMTPKFIINLVDPKKYLMINVQLLVEGPENIAKVKKHMPILRNDMIMMLSNLHASDVQTMEQREALRLKTRQLIIDILTKIQNPDGFRDVYFSEFLVT